jgi:hypothetical protein
MVLGERRSGPVVGSFLGLVLTALLATPSRADRPEAESLPPPRAVPTETVTVFTPAPLPLYHRTSQYDVWQLYAPDRRGFFRPRVIVAPHGAYYLYNGQPYPWLPVRQLDVTPTVVD